MTMVYVAVTQNDLQRQYHRARQILSRVHVLCTVETRDRAHIAELQQRLAESGVELS